MCTIPALSGNALWLSNNNDDDYNNNNNNNSNNNNNITIFIRRHALHIRMRRLTTFKNASAIDVSCQ